MKKTLIALLLAAALTLCACGGTASSSAAPQSGEPQSGAPETEDAAQTAELPADETVLGTVFGKDVLYTDYRLYLDLEDRAYLDSLRNEMALNLLLEREMSERGVAAESEDFESYAAEAYYSEMLSEPRLIDEINAACELTGLMGGNLDLALYEAYRQGYCIEKLGDFFSETYRSENEQGEKTDEDFDADAVAYANEQLYALAGELAQRIEIPSDDQLLARIDGEEVALEDRHKAYLILAVARNRINLANSILIGEGMRHELLEARGEEAVAQAVEAMQGYRDYVAPTFESAEFAEAYGSLLEARGATKEQMLESVVRTFTAMMGFEEAYYQMLSEQYEAATGTDVPETFEEYYADRCEELYAQCVAVNPMG